MPVKLGMETEHKLHYKFRIKRIIYVAS